MARNSTDVIVEAFAGGVPMFHVSGAAVPSRCGVYLYQRDDGAWLPVFPRDGGAIAEPSPDRPAVDVPGAVTECFPELVR